MPNINIRNPVNPYPQNIMVDPDETKIEFVFSGDRLGAYKINVYTYSSNPEVSEAFVKSEEIILTDYIYNNTKIITNISLAEIGVTSGSYTWEVIMYPEKAVNGENSFKSLRYFFEASSPPYISSNDSDDSGKEDKIKVNGIEYGIIDNALNIQLYTRNINIDGFYKGASIKYYYFQLEDESGNVIEKTDKIFSNKISYNFTGFISPNKYILRLFTISQKEQYVNIEFKISVTYNLDNNLSYPPELICDENETSIKIKWLKDSSASGEATGEYEFINKGVKINTGEIIYDNISSLPIEMNEKNFAFGIKTIIDDNTTKIFDYINNNWLYSVYVEAYKIFLKKNRLGLTTYKPAEIIQLKDQIKFGIQPTEDAQPEPNTGYMMYVGDEYEIKESDDFWIVVPENQDYSCSILLQNSPTTDQEDIGEMITIIKE